MKTQFVYLGILIIAGLCQDVSQASSCTEHGRYPNDENSDCRGYIMCLLGGITKFTQYKLNCPQGSIYSHLEQQCTNATNYKCYPSFNCTIVSNFVNPESENCSSYITCVQGMDDISTARLIQCPIDTVFNETVGECVDKNLSTCYSAVVKPVTRHPLDDSNNNDNVHIYEKPIRSSSSAAVNYLKYSLLHLVILIVLRDGNNIVMI